MKQNTLDQNKDYAFAIVNRHGYVQQTFDRITEARTAWDNLPFEGKHGLFQLVGQTIDGKWYRLSWIEF